MAAAEEQRRCRQRSSFTTASKAFTDSGFRLKALLKSMATSPEFYAAPAPVVETKSAETSSATKVAAQ